MNTYIDSSALVPLYVTERFSDAADAAVTAAGDIPFTPMHQLELTNAFERLRPRVTATMACAPDGSYQRHHPHGDPQT